MYSEEFLNGLRKLGDYMRFESMTKLERRKYYKSKLKPAHNRINKGVESVREIKFRAWDINNEKMFRVDRIDYRDDNFGIREVRRAAEYPINVADQMYYDLLEIELMQYTGLVDVNGREIYEGDIVKADSEYGEYVRDIVCWSYGSFYVANHTFKQINNIEVIGNIYQDKDLLKENKYLKRC